MTAQEAIADRLQRATQALQQGQANVASDVLKPVAKQLQDSPGALHLMALIARAQGDLQHAIIHMRRAVSLSSQDAQLHCALGNLLCESGAHDAGFASYRRALDRDPAHRNALHNLATQLLARGRGAQAVAALRRLCTLEPSDPAPLNLLGIALSDAGDVDGAIEHLRRAIQLAPGFAQAHLNLGVAYGYAGKLEQARSEYHEAVKLAPQLARGWESLVRATRITDAQRPLLDTLRSQFEAAAEHSDDKVVLAFALGKAHDDLGEYERAFSYYRSGNDTVKMRQSKRKDMQSRLWAQVAAASGLEFFAAHSGHGVNDSRPVFVVGMPRSGTTLVEQLLAAHPAVYPAGERLHIPTAAARLCDGIVNFPHGLAEVDASNIGNAAQQVLAELQALAPQAQWIIDKLPGNYVYLGLIRVMFPKAHIIHCRRHPLDTCLSIYFQRFAHGHEWAYCLRSIAECYRGYHQLMQHWRQCLPGGFADVVYEDLVHDPRASAEALFDFLGASHVAPLEASSGRGHTVKTASTWQVREPVHERSVARWRHYDQYLDVLKDELGDLL